MKLLGVLLLLVLTVLPIKTNDSYTKRKKVLSEMLFGLPSSKITHKLPHATVKGVI